jgi:hypothetical protein
LALFLTVSEFEQTTKQYKAAPRKGMISMQNQKTGVELVIQGGKICVGDMVELVENCEREKAATSHP